MEGRHPTPRPLPPLRYPAPTAPTRITGIHHALRFAASVLITLLGAKGARRGAPSLMPLNLPEVA